MAPEQDRRIKPQRTESELYKSSDVAGFIQKERRKDELDRLREVQEQKNLWKHTVLFCLLLNGILLGLAIYGWVQHGFS